MNKNEYQEYLKSEHWQTTRKQKLKEQRYTCENCNSKNCLLHVHHLTYARLGAERMEDLKVLCEACHYQEHNPHKTHMEHIEEELAKFFRLW